MGHGAMLTNLLKFIHVSNTIILASLFMIRTSVSYCKLTTQILIFCLSKKSKSGHIS